MWVVSGSVRLTSFRVLLLRVSSMNYVLNVDGGRSILVLSTVERKVVNVLALRLWVRLQPVIDLLWKKKSNRPLVCRMIRGIFVCASVLLATVTIRLVVRLIVVQLVPCSTVSLVVAVIGPLDSAFVRHIGFRGVSTRTILV